MKYRVYYNNSQDPQRWSVDEGTSETEITVLGIRFDSVQADTVTADDAEPKAWLRVDCVRLVMAGGIATFRDY